MSLVDGPAAEQEYTRETAPSDKVGLKYDAGKVRYDLLYGQFTGALEGIAKVLTFGAEKYPHPETKDCSWKDVEDALGRYLAAKGRHEAHVQRAIAERFFGIKYGEPVEHRADDSGLLHIDHAITNLLFLRGLLYGRG